MDRSLIESYFAGATRPAQAIRGLSAADLDALPIPGTWSIRQIIAHLMDSDLIASDRMKRVIAMDNPTILAYDEAAFAKRLGYGWMDVELACKVFELNRRLTTELLRSLPDAAFSRRGQHSESGPLTLQKLLEIYTNHLDHHLGFLQRKRTLLGKAL
jgi:uncharacterized damage-inducible protein DinB